MPTVAGKFLRAVICLALAAFLYQTAVNVATVKVVVFEDGEVKTVVIDDEDPRYQKEIKAARRNSIALYVGAVIMVLACFNYLRSARRIYRYSQQHGDGP